MSMEYSISEICQIIGGGTPKTSVAEYWNGDINWLSVKDFAGDCRYVYDTEKKITELGLNNSSTKLLQKDDIIISARGTVGEMAMIPYPMAFNQSCFGIRGNEKIDNTYLYYLLKTKIRDLKKQANGAVFDTITISTFSNIICDIPELEVQKKIAAQLSEIDDKIAINRRICENLEAQAQALFKHWFIDFAPFLDKPSGKAERKDGQFVESELGLIPKGWKVGRLTEIAEYLNGLAMQKFPPLSDDDAIPVLKIKELGQSQCDNNSDKCSKQIKPEYIIKNGDVVFSWSGTLMVDIWCGGICGLNQHLFKVTSDTYPKWFYLMWTKHHLAEFIRIAKDKAVTMGHIKRGDLDKALVLIPDSNTFAKMSDVMEDIYNQIINTRLESNTLSTLRDTLLPKLMSGQIRI